MKLLGTDQWSKRFAAILVTVALLLFSDSALAQSGNPQAMVLGPKINRLTQNLLPFTINISPAAAPDSSLVMTLIDVRFCGAESLNGARILALGHPGPAPAQRPTPIIVSADCQATLANIAQKAVASSDAPPWAAVAEISATWGPWELQLAIRDVATALKPGASITPPSDLKATLQNGGKAFKSLKTSDIRITIEGAVEVYNLAVQFVGSNVSLTLIPAAQVPTFTSAMINASDNLLTGATAPAGTTLILKAPYSFTTNLLSTNLKDKPLAIDRDSTGNPTLTAKNLTVSGGVDTISVAGLVRDIPTNAEVNARVEWKGTDDLKLSSIKLDAILEDCAGHSGLKKIQCQQRNNARKIATAALGTILTNRYQNRPLRPVGPRNLIPFELAGKKYSLRTVVQRTQSTAIALYLYNDFVIEPQ